MNDKKLQIMNRPWTKYWNLLIIGCVLLISACNAPQAPDFQGVENLKIDVQGMSGARINGDAKFFNPNNKSVTLKGVNVAVSVENKMVKEIEREYDIRAEPNSNFSVPIDVTISLADLNMGPVEYRAEYAQRRQEEGALQGQSPGADVRPDLQRAFRL